MAGKIPAWGNFNIPTAVFDTHEWVADEFIDGELGATCTLYFPAKREECDNCIFDNNSGRSSDIYKAGGPIEFANYMTCPRCQGRGYLSLPDTEQIRLRTYWEPSTWRDIGMKVADPTGVCVVIGYMDDLPKLERATKILLNDDLNEVRNYLCAREGEAQAWGFRRNRYFTQLLRRTNGG